MSGFGQVWFVLVIGIMGLLWLIFSRLVNPFITKINQFISAGELSLQFVTWWNFAVGMFAAIVVIMLLGSVAWAWVRSIEQKNEGGY